MGFLCKSPSPLSLRDSRLLLQLVCHSRSKTRLTLPLPFHWFDLPSPPPPFPALPPLISLFMSFSLSLRPLKLLAHATERILAKSSLLCFSLCVTLARVLILREASQRETELRSPFLPSILRFFVIRFTSVSTRLSEKRWRCIGSPLEWWSPLQPSSSPLCCPPPGSIPRSCSCSCAYQRR